MQVSENFERFARHFLGRPQSFHFIENSFIFFDPLMTKFFKVIF